MIEVSVIIPVYNGEKYIKDSINSVLNQTFKDLEIIIVNDASTDKTEKIIFENFKDLIKQGKIKYFKNSKNKERVFSRNFGFDMSSGKFVFFLDYDDIWDRNYVYNVLNIINKYDIVYSFPKTIIDYKSKIVHKSKKNLESLEVIIFSGNIGYPSATALKRESFLYYNENFLMREDWELFLKSYLNNLKIFILDNDKVYIREHTNRTSKNKDFYAATMKVFYYYKDKVPEKYLPYFYFHISEVAFKFGDFKTGYSMFFEAIKRNPQILLNKRNFLTFLKRSIRIDRFL